MTVCNCLRHPVRRVVVSLLISILSLISLHAIQAQSSPYTWKSVIDGGGGFVPGIIYSQTTPGLVYARTDMGGAYRWSDSSRQWLALTDMMDRNNSDYMGILSIALDPKDSNRVYMECGKYTQSWAGTGAVLASTDKGKTWKIDSLSVKIGGNEDGRGAGERLQVDPSDDSVLFMGTTANGLWKSSDFSSTWTKVASFSAANVNFVLFDTTGSKEGKPTQRIFVATVNTGGQSLYETTDGGTTWNTVPGQPTSVMAIRGAIVDSTLYLTFSNYQGPNGATSGSVWKYNTASRTWTNISPSTGSYGFSGISVYPKNSGIVIVSTLDRWSPMDEVYLTTDGGATWKGRLVGMTLDHSFAPYTSTVNPHWLACVAMNPFDSSKAMFGTGFGIWACDNLFTAAPTWYFKDQNLEETVPMQIISPPFTNVMSAVGDYDGFRNDDLDSSPSKGRYSPPKGTTLSIASAANVPSKLVKAYNASPFGAYSTDGGTSWIDFRGGRVPSYPKGTTAGGTWSIAVSADGQTIVWAPTGAATSYSTNNGSTWTASSGAPAAVPPVADRVNPNKFYAYLGSYGQLWVSTDAAKTFAQTGISLPAVPSWQSQDGNVTATPGHEGDLWFCCGGGGLYRSTNSGASANKVVSATAAYLLGFGKSSTAGGYPALYLWGVVNNVLGIFRSDDSGSSWIRINDDNHQFGYLHQISGDPRVYGRCYISAEGRGVSYGQAPNSDTTDNPSTFLFNAGPADSVKHFDQNVTVSWGSATAPGGAALTYILHFFGPGVDTTFTASETSATFSVGEVLESSSYTLTGCVTNGWDTTATSNSLTILTSSTLTDVKTGSIDMPKEFSLSQNFPNPFNPGTMISYQLPMISHVTLKIYDVLGREVAVLVNQVESLGRHEVRFDGQKLASGVYLCRIIATGASGRSFVSQRKMVLVK